MENLMDNFLDIIISKAEHWEHQIPSGEEIEIDDFDGNIWVSRYSISRGSTQGLEKICRAKQVDLAKLRMEIGKRSWYYCL